jgi:hypothetical protein
MDKDTKVSELPRNGRIPEYLEIFETDKHIFLREPSAVKTGTPRSIDSGVEKCKTSCT